MARGRLRVYLGAAPGVGKTVAMLGEGRRRASRGTDVVIGVVEDHGRTYTAEQVSGLEVLPRRTVVHRGVALTDLDVQAVLTRAPQVALVDELAHTNAPGGAHEKRWQDVQDLLAAGIDVITTVNVQHLESLNDVVGSITGVTQAETVPDEVVRAADQIELVDMTPQALRRRMAHGHIYPSEVIDTALGNYFREGNLTALRELALLWVADRVDEGLARYRAEHGITRHLGGPGTDRGGPDRRTGGADAAAPRGPDRGTGIGPHAGRRARGPFRRRLGGGCRRDRTAATADRTARWHLPARRRRRHRRRCAGFRPCGQHHADRRRRVEARPARPARPAEHVDGHRARLR